MRIMQRNLEHSLNEVQELIMSMSQQTEDAVLDAIDALDSGDVELAQQVIDGDNEVDSMSDAAEEMISRFLARQQPVAGDLRLTIGAMKIATDLERICDHAVNIAESAISLSSQASLPEKDNLLYMATLVKQMLVSSIESFIERNTIIARGVINADDEVDEYNKLITQGLVEDMMAQKVNVKVGMDIVRICKNLERIADLSTNIAEDVIYINDGKTARHDRVKH
jgi:phosphate transport system protein